MPMNVRLYDRDERELRTYVSPEFSLGALTYDMKTDKTGSVSYEELSSSSTTTYSYSLADAANEHVWWSDVSGNTKFDNWNGYVAISTDELNAAGIGNGTIIRIYFTSESGYTIKATDNTWDDFELNNTGWNKNRISGNAKNGYVEFKLNTTTANRFKQNGLIIQGTGATALALTYDNSQKVADEVPVAESEIWTGPLDFGWSNKISLPLDAFMNKGVKGGSIIRFYVESTATNYNSNENEWEFTIFTGYEQGWTMANSYRNGSNTDISKGYFDYILTSDDAQVLAMEKNLGWTPGSSLQVQGQKFKLNKITLIP